MSDIQSYVNDPDHKYQIYYNDYGILGESNKQMFAVNATDEKQTQQFRVNSNINLSEFFASAGFNDTYDATHGDRMHSLWVRSSQIVKFFDLIDAEIKKKNMSIDPSDVEAYQRFREKINKLRAENVAPQLVGASAAPALQAHSASAVNQQIRSNL